MKIKRYVGATMREVLAQVRLEQGPDVVIISNRRAEGGGVELTTAVDYDDALVNEAMREPGRTQEAGQSASARVDAQAVAAAYGIDVEPEHSVQTQGGPRMAWSQDPSLVAMRREVETLRELMEQQMAAMSWNDRMRREPVHARVLMELSKVGVAPDAARLLVRNLNVVTRDAEPARMAMALLMKHVAVADETLLGRDRVVTLVGGTGMGKTTSIVKLATRHAQKHGPKSVGFISIAEDRIGGRDELVAFCRLLDAPLLRVQTPRGLAAALEQLRDRSLVLIDTPGTGARDPRLSERLELLKHCATRGRVLLTLAANTDQTSLEALTCALLPLRPSGVLLTKTDEAAGFGGVLSVLVRHALPLAYVSTGQGLVDDLHSAASRRVWLIKQAYALGTRSESVVPVDEHYMAEHFGRQAKHA